MPHIAYITRKFNRATQSIIDAANSIIQEYQAAGYDLTLRQLYYQFVSRDLLPNSQKEYKRLGDIISNARLAGEIDWDAITDRTRNLVAHSSWSSPSSIIRSAAYSYQRDLWENQDSRVEIWVEKEALVDVFTRAGEALRLPVFACKGYTSQSEMHAAAKRLEAYCDAGQEPIILHFGDHDPSGIDMTRDIEDRMEMFGAGAQVRRLALNMDQVRQYNPPPNPAKMTDSRVDGYIRKYGRSSWELDALDPRTLAGIVQAEVVNILDRQQWNRDLAVEQRETEQLEKAAKHWPAVAEFVSNLED